MQPLLSGPRACRGPSPGGPQSAVVVFRAVGGGGADLGWGKRGLGHEPSGAVRRAERKGGHGDFWAPGEARDVASPANAR